MLSNNSLERMQGIFKRLDRAELILAPSITNANPTVSETYNHTSMLFNQPIDNIVTSNLFSFDPINPIAAGSEPNGILIKNNKLVWKETTETPTGNIVYFDSVYDMTNNEAINNSFARVGKKIGDIVYDFVLYEVDKQAFDLTIYQENTTSSGPLSLNEAYAQFSTLQSVGDYPNVGIRLDSNVATHYYIAKAYHQEGDITRKATLSGEALYQLVYKISDFTTETLTFNSVTSITIPEIKISLLEEV